MHIFMFSVIIRIQKSSTIEKSIANDSGNVWDHSKRQKPYMFNKRCTNTNHCQATKGTFVQPCLFLVMESRCSAGRSIRVPRPLVSPKFPRVPQEGGWCKGGSRNVERWRNSLGGGIPLIENKTFQSIRVSMFRSFETPFNVFLEEIDPILPNSHFIFSGRY